MSTLAKALARGVVAGAAATTALNAVTYLDMAVRRRPASSTPQQTVEKGAERVHLPLPQEDAQRDAVETGLGSLLGIVAGVATGTSVAVLQHLGLPRGHGPTLATTFGLVMVAGNGPMTVLGITDPRTWSGTDWAADVVPHLAYAATVDAALTLLDG